MKKAFALLFLLPLLLVSTASAAGLSGLISSAGELPDPAALLGGKAFIYEEDVEVNGALYVAFTFATPEDYTAFLKEYAALAEAAGYSITESRILDMDAQQISSGARSAYLVPDYRGALLFLVNTELDYAALPTPTPTPRPTQEPTPRPAAPSTTGSSGASTNIGGGSSGGHTEFIEVKQDCFACANGRCDLCNGSGWYRLYGERVPCTTYCTTCDGLGYWYSTQPVWVP